MKALEVVKERNITIICTNLLESIQKLFEYKLNGFKMTFVWAKKLKSASSEVSEELVYIISY